MYCKSLWKIASAKCIIFNIKKHRSGINIKNTTCNPHSKHDTYFAHLIPPTIFCLSIQIRINSNIIAIGMPITAIKEIISS